MPIRSRASEWSSSSPGGGAGRSLGCTRNLSDGGISFLRGGFLYPGSNIRILLPTLGGAKIVIRGRVASCRLLAGRIHEVGVTFHEKYDPIRAASVGEGMDRIKRLQFDLLIAELDTLTRRHDSPVGQLRSAGFVGPMIRLISDLRGYPDDPHEDLTLLPRSFEPIDFIQRVADALSASGAGEQEKPLYSELQHDSRMGPLIAEYVEFTHTSVRRLEEARSVDNLERAFSICRNLNRSASGYGFPALREATPPPSAPSKTRHMRRSAARGSIAWP